MDYLSVYTIFERPTDFPNKFVVREFRVTGGTVAAQLDCQLADSLAEARTLVPPGRYRIDGRGDPLSPHAVESWV